MGERDEKGGITRRELFKTLGLGALAVGLPTELGERAGGERAAAGAEPAGGARVVGPGAARVVLQVNGESRTVEVEPRVTLLEALRDHLGLTGAKPVCERGACGACTVHLDGEPHCSCMLLAVEAEGRRITTVEGLAAGDRLTPLQQAFIDHDALQCGFCTPGMLMSCSALLDRARAAGTVPTADDVRRAVSGNLCRCGAYPHVFAATVDAARRGPKGG